MDASASSAVLRHVATRASVVAVVTALLVVPSASPALAATWTVVPSANPAQFDNIFWGNDISSATSGWAVGVGGNSTAPFQSPIIQRYDGTRLTAVASPAVSGGGQLRDVDATSTTNAWAVGFSNTSTGNAGLTERWNGASWQIVPVTDPAPGFQNFLTGVKAFADGTAWAVGSSSVPGSLNFDTVAQRWNGSRWVRVPTPNPVAGRNEFNRVDGTSPTDVWAVGLTQVGDDGVEQPLIEHWDGNIWKVVDVPPERAAWLDSVVAIAANDAWAVGTQFSIEQLRFVPYALHWNGTTWTEVAVPSPTTGPSRLTGVAALGPKQVYAVGESSVLRWNGTVWSAEPVGVTGSTLWDAAAAAPASVLAVGTRPRDSIGTLGTFAIRTNNG